MKQAELMRGERGDAATVVVAVVAIAAICAAAYFAVLNYQKQYSAAKPATSAVATATPSMSAPSRANGGDVALFRVAGFFNGYSAGFSQADNKAQRAAFLAQNLAPALIATKEAMVTSSDPYVCGQNFPAAWRFDNPTGSGQMLSVAVHSVGYSPEITITAQYDTATHLITDITCPAK